MECTCITTFWHPGVSLQYILNLTTCIIIGDHKAGRWIDLVAYVSLFGHVPLSWLNRLTKDLNNQSVVEHDCKLRYVKKVV